LGFNWQKGHAERDGGTGERDQDRAYHAELVQSLEK
jgi:hypothetical protein